MIGEYVALFVLVFFAIWGITDVWLKRHDSQGR